MTPDLKDLIDSTFYVMYHLHIPPSEIDNFSIYEMREYVSLIRERNRSESESDSNIFKSLANLLKLRKRS